MNEVTPRRRFPWLKAALTLSLVLNLALLGVLGGLIKRVGQSGSDLRSAVSALPAEDRRALRRETGRIWREARLRHGAEGSRAQMIAALQAEEFDKAAFEAALQDAQERLVRMSDEMHGRLVARVAQMSAEERGAYAAALEAQARRRAGPRERPSR